MCSCMYCRNIRMDHGKNFILSVSLFPESLSSIAPLYWRGCISNICATMPYYSSSRTWTDTLKSLMICRGCIHDFSPLVYTTAILSLFTPPFIRMWWTISDSSLTGKGFPLERASW